MRAFAVAYVLGLAMLAACNDPVSKAPAAKVEPETIKAAPPPALNAAEAFRLAFGGPSPVVRRVKDAETDYMRELTYTPARLIELGDIRALVSKAQSADDCHICSGALAIHYLKPEAGSWKVVAGTMELVPGQGFGMPPEIELRRDLGPSPVLVAEAGWTGQGYTCNTVDLIELGPEAPHVLVENLLVHTDNRGAAMEDSDVEVTDARLKAGPDGAVIVTYRGHREGQLTFSRRGPKLMPTAGDQSLNEC